jgi:ATP synthase protein I
MAPGGVLASLSAGVMINVLITQLVLVGILAVGLSMQGLGAALAALYGGGIAIGNTLLLHRRVTQANRLLRKDAETDVRSMYLGALERFIFTMLAMVAGMAWIKLEPAFLLIGFAFSYLGHPFSRFVPTSALPGGKG